MTVSVLVSLALYILLASLFSTVYTNDIDGCPPIHVQKNRILRTKESLNNGAKYIRREIVQSAKECYKFCCESKGCNLGMLSYKNASSSHGGLVRTCYLFDCGSPTKCKFSPYDHYATIEFEDEGGDKSNKVDQRPKSGTKSQQESCAPGDPIALCMSDPCNDAVCHGNPLALCKPSMCGSCHAEFFDDDGRRVNCYAQNRDNKPDKTKSSNENKWIDSNILAEIEKTHSSTHKKPVHKTAIQDLESRLHAMTNNDHHSHQGQSRFSVSKSPMNMKDQNQHQNLWNNQVDHKTKDDELQAHGSRGLSSSHVKYPPPTTDPPFHAWRKFIDNNPDYGTAKLVTEKPTPKPAHKKSTEAFHQWREFIDNNPKYANRPKTIKTTHPTKIPTKPKPMKKNNKPKPGSKIPPKVDNDNTGSKRNITDVQVVIETNHLRIVENKAVVPLAIFLVIALVMLIVVGLRLRMIKNRMRRKAFATDDADYLINGMYL